MQKKKRDYKREYETYHSKPKAKKERSQRNSARRQAEKDGRVKKGDGLDLDHIKPIRQGGSNSKKNTRVVSKSSNRSRNGSAGGRPKGSTTRKKK